MIASVDLAFIVLMKYKQGIQYSGCSLGKYEMNLKHTVLVTQDQSGTVQSEVITIRHTLCGGGGGGDCGECREDEEQRRCDTELLLNFHQVPQIWTQAEVGPIFNLIIILFLFNNLTTK